MRMKLITRNTDYAIRAVCYLACHDKDIVPAAEFVEKLKTPRPFLRKILQELNKKGLVRSFKGIGGGFELAVPKEKIRVIDIVRIFQGEPNLNECFFKKAPCPNRKICALKKRLDKIERYVISELGSITIKEIIGKAG